jgi:hypothetical protein
VQKLIERVSTSYTEQQQKPSNPPSQSAESKVFLFVILDFHLNPKHLNSFLQAMSHSNPLQQKEDPKLEVIGALFESQAPSPNLPLESESRTTAFAGTLCKPAILLPVGSGRLARRSNLSSEMAAMRVAIKAVQTSQVCTPVPLFLALH